MKNIWLDDKYITDIISDKHTETTFDEYKELFEQVLKSPEMDEEKVLGWMNLEQIANEELITKIENKAKEIRENADIFVLIGVGGSNQGARATLKALQSKGKPEVLYTGNNLSPKYMNDILKKIEGKSVYVNIIAKNFSTLEPGLCFRVIRQYMEKTYGEKEAANRIIATGSPEGSSLETLAMEKGYMFLPFPIDVGGRYSVMSAVGLLPISVGGICIRELIQGAQSMKEHIYSTSGYNSDVLKYAIIRNYLYNQGYAIEMISYFEPAFEYFGKWWVQLFGESEGKDDKGIFPTAGSFSEDLHSLGQWIQSGKKNIFETFLNIEKDYENLIVKADASNDYFDYLDGMDFADINRTAYKATIRAHSEGGVPCITINIPELSTYYLGQLFFFFEVACYVSSKILGVNPFDQPGVEAYKGYMFKALKK